MSYDLGSLFSRITQAYNLWKTYHHFLLIYSRLGRVGLGEAARMDLFQLETFLAVSEERSFSRAAARLHRTQPAVSQAIAKLEAELGEVLLERSSRDGTLTDAGEVLREYAVKLLNLRTEAAGRQPGRNRPTPERSSNYPIRISSPIRSAPAP